MGRVYEVEDAMLGKRFALKTLLSPSLQVGEVVLRMALESRALVRVEHPNIVTVFAAGTTEDGAFYYVMELLRGSTLREVIFARKRLEPRLAVLIALAVANALEHAHGEGVIHRDLKPDNIFLSMQADRSTSIKVVDFGVAGFFDGLQGLKEDEGLMVGTPCYASPEQQRGEKVTARLDVWSLGVVLFEMVTGYVPFAGRSMTEIFGLVQCRDAAARVSDVVAGVPERLAQLVARMLEKDASLRIESMAAVRAELEAIRIDAPLPQGANAPPEAWRPVRALPPRILTQVAPSAAEPYTPTLPAPGLTIDPRERKARPHGR